MSSPPGDDPIDDGTVMRPVATPRPPPPAATTPSASSDPHAPALTAGTAAPEGNALPVGTYLGEFELTEVIGEGGFGIVYLATDHSLQRRVALKEYMPSSLAERTSGMQVSSLSPDDEETFRKGLDSFINEARLLAQFDHPSLVKVHRFWEANGTAYMVMPFYEGPTLKQVLRDMGGPPDEAWLLGLLDPLTQALAVIHAQQCFHRDIAPDNVLLLAGSHRPLLLDFGAARRVIGDANQALTVILKPGYAPIEQYAEVPDMRQGPWTDVYALAAVLYFAILGKKPPAAVGRLINDQYVPLVQQAAGRYSPGFLAAIDRALAVRPADRTPDIHAFRADLGFAPLGDAGAGTGTPGPAMAAGASAGDGRGRAATGGVAAATAGSAGGTRGAAPAGASTGRRPLMLGGLGAAVLAVAGGTWVALRGRGGAAPAQPPVAAAPSAGPATAPAAGPPPAATPAAAPPPPAAPAEPFSVQREFRRIVASQTPGFSVEARTTRTSLRIDRDKLFVTINSSRDGFFYVLSESPDGQLIQFFPNQLAPTNQILGGASLTLPSQTRDPKTGQLPQDIVLTEPPGQAHLLVLVSRYPRDFSLLGNRRIASWSEFPSGAAGEALARAQPPGAPSIYAGRPICPAAGACTDEYGAALVAFDVVR